MEAFAGNCIRGFVRDGSKLAPSVAYSASSHLRWSTVRAPFPTKKLGSGHAVLFRGQRIWRSSSSSLSAASSEVQRPPSFLFFLFWGDSLGLRDWPFLLRLYRSFWPCLNAPFLRLFPFCGVSMTALCKIFGYLSEIKRRACHSCPRLLFWELWARF